MYAAYKLSILMSSIFLMQFFGLEVALDLKTISTVFALWVTAYTFWHTRKSRKEAEEMREIQQKQSEIIERLYKNLNDGNNTK